ncbi:F-box/FBD/LRR-repeat protein At1g13570-like [Telopea speciosissima]|uniref:F-box/FBD/LRR-repeat protein At1g13570-like n=1 Tax=Telopea speciosissima TaxID=54955 RepID=UPI001CC51306|nr:F-box/FBD/LRR-repeat protein At1g13570-like [Telopea speciosissima]
MEIASRSIPDMLSNLPEEILAKIFSSLSIRDVVRTSILSTNWRYKWISVPHLIFNDECIPVSDGSLVCHDKLVKIINHVLLHNRDPILTFKISSSHLQTSSEIDIVPPVTFKGFSCPTNLVFKKVTISSVTLKCLVSACPQLESLTLTDIDGPIFIELSNPKLKYLWISGKFTGMCLKDLRHLVFASFDASTADHFLQWRTCNISNILGSLVSIQKLVMGGWFLQSLVIGDVARRLPNTYDHLKTISLALNAVDMKEILIAISLLNSSPNLQELKIWLWYNREYAIVPVVDLQEAKDQLECTFNKLRVVYISEFSGMEIDLVLVKFILANSPMLETMKIKFGIGIEPLPLLKQLLQFKRVSPHAEIVYLDPKT